MADKILRNTGPDIRKCHCGKEFENTRVAGGSRKGGPVQKYCSPICNQHANTWWRVYGITPEEYWETLRIQGDGCAICHEKEKSRDKFTLAVDHEHVEGYENLPPEEKRKFFRGLLCNVCNRWRVAKNDIQTARAVLEYLEKRPFPRRSG